MDHHPPVAEFVAEAFDDHGSVIRKRSGGGALLVDVGGQVGPGVVVQVELVEAGRLPRHLAVEPADSASEFGGAAFVFAAPERQPSGAAGGRRDQHLVTGDLLDSPGGRPQSEDVADPRFVDHFLVQLAHPASTLLVRGQEDPEHAAVWDGAT